jgi:hypothetical protein
MLRPEVGVRGRRLILTGLALLLASGVAGLAALARQTFLSDPSFCLGGRAPAATFPPGLLLYGATLAGATALLLLGYRSTRKRP